MSISDKIIQELDMLDERERQKVLKKIIDKYMSNEVIYLNENYAWWDNEEDDIYNDK